MSRFRGRAYNLEASFGQFWLIALLGFSGCAEEPQASPDGGATGGSLGSGGSPSVGGSSAGGTVGASGGSVGVGGSANPTGGAPNGGGAATGGVAASGGSSNSGGDSQGSSGGAESGVGGASSAGAMIVPDPSWTCGMPEGIVDPELGELVFEATLEIGEVYDVGQTQYGERRVFDIQGGEIESARVNASFLSGGLDMELVLSNGAIELEQVNVLRADDGAIVYVRTCGIAPAGDSKVRIVPDFEAPNSSSLAWLNTGQFVGTRSYDAEKGEMTIAIYDVADVTGEGTRVELQDPEGVADQPWECSTNTGARGATVLTETVTLGGSLSVGASKRGNRNIIPITGGTVTGRFPGEVLPGGADYQLLGGSTVLDARYTLKSNDGEYLVVRNCGPFGALIPWFETRADGPYAFLNEGAYLSSDPGSASGGVSITFYERQ